MIITFGKQTFDFDVTSDMSIDELKKLIQYETGYDIIRLIYAGKTLLDDARINSIPGDIHAKLTMIASRKDSLEVLKPDQSIRIKNDLEVTEDIPSYSNPRKSRPVFIKDGYGFHDIQTLPNLPNEGRARDILEELASDPGFLSVMKKHRWNVGCLGELYPEGFVGVSEVCILGLNENKGQRILLRIRTDDLEGFRKMSTIRQVLCHELSHMEHSEHNDDFFILMRKIEKEVIELDWTKSKFRTLNERNQSHRIKWTEESEEIESQGNNDADKSVKEKEFSFDQFTDHSRSMPDSQIPDNTCAVSLPSILSNGLEMPDSLIDVNQKSELQFHTVSDSNTAIGSQYHSLESLPINPPDEGLISVQQHDIEKFQILTKTLQLLDEASISLVEMQQILSQDRFINFIEAVRQYTVFVASGHNNTTDLLDQWKWTIQLIRKIFSNIKEHPNDDKLRKLRKDTKTFQKLIEYSNDYGVKILTTGGFQDESDVIHMKVSDPGFLYFASDILQQILV